MAAWPTGTGDGLSTTIPANYGSGEKVSDRVTRTSFGDGYSQRTTDGINNAPRSWNIEYRSISDTDADVFETFLSSIGWSRDSFTWTPPNQATSRTWTLVTGSYSRTPAGYNTSDLSMNFQEEFDL